MEHVRVPCRVLAYRTGDTTFPLLFVRGMQVLDTLAGGQFVPHSGILLRILLCAPTRGEGGKQPYVAFRLL